MILLPRVDGFTLHGEDSLPAKTDYLIGNFIPMKGVGLLVGEPRIGKTFLTIGMAASIASGSLFLGQYLAASSRRGTAPRRIESGATLIIAGEGLDTYAPRLTAAYQGLGDEYRGRLAELGCPDRLPVYRRYQQGLRDEKHFDQFFGGVCELAASIEIFSPMLPLRLIVVDTLPAVFSFNDENSAAEAQGAFGKLVRLSEAIGAFILATVHPSKNSKRGSVRGSGVFEGSPDLILTATKGSNDSRKLTVTKSRANAAEGQSWGYRFVQVPVPNDEPSAYVDGLLRAPVPPPPPSAELEGGRMTRDATQVFAALRSAIHNAPTTWQARDGRTFVGTDERAIRAELEKIKAPTSADTRQRQDAERKTLVRGVEWLLREGVIDQHDHRDGRVVYRIVG